MAAPSVQGTAATTQTTSDAITAAVTLPSGISAGEGLVAIVATDGATYADTASTGWTRVAFTNSGSGITTCLFYAWDASVVTALQLDFYTDNTKATTKSEQCEAVVFRVSGHDTSTAPFEAHSTNASSTSWAGVALSGLTADDYLFLAVASPNANGSTFSAYPTGYTTIGELLGTSGANDTLTVGYKQGSAATGDTPSGWTLSVARAGVKATVGIKPAAAGSGVTADHTQTFVLGSTAAATVETHAAATQTFVLGSSIDADVLVGAVATQTFVLGSSIDTDVAVKVDHTQAFSLGHTAAFVVGDPVRTADHAQAFALGHSAAATVLTHAAHTQAFVLGSSADASHPVTADATQAFALGSSADADVIVTADAEQAFVLGSTASFTVTNIATVDHTQAFLLGSSAAVGVEVKASATQAFVLTASASFIIEDTPSAAQAGWTLTAPLPTRDLTAPALTRDLTAPAITRVLTAPLGGPMATIGEWSAKDPSDNLILGIEFSTLLGSDTISGTPTWSVQPSDLTLGAKSNTTTKASQRVSGGTSGQAYTVSCTITTTAGDTYQRSGIIRVENQ